MSGNEVENPIINAPFEEPRFHWLIHQHEAAEKIPGRRKAAYFYLPPGATAQQQDQLLGHEEELPLVNQVRKQLAKWREAALRGEGGVTRVTMELLQYWRREGREQPLFFAQLEAAETIIFLTEARGDFLQGIDIPPDELSSAQRAEGIRAFRRMCCKMATGTGKTTVMAMLAAWSILNKVNDRRDARFSDSVLVICPNVTIRERLRELNPQHDAGSIYRTRDLVPPSSMALLRQGKVHTTNWHALESRDTQGGYKVRKVGKRIFTREKIYFGESNTTSHGKRYLTEDSLRQKIAIGAIKVLADIKSKGERVGVEVEAEKYIESDGALVHRVLHKTFGAGKNILVFNDEAHHAYRLRDADDDDAGAQNEAFADGKDERDYYYRGATVWVEGLDKINKLRNINVCVDFSATPYFLGKAGNDTNRIFPWTVSDFGLQDAIEAGLVKIPQLAVRDTTGHDEPDYYNIWNWILNNLTAAERGGGRGEVKPEAVLKRAHTPIAMMGGMWREQFNEMQSGDDERPPVLIIVCKTRKLADVVYEWIAEGVCPTNIPSAGFAELRNSEDKENTICVYSDLQRKLEGESQDDNERWMRFTLDTIGKTKWPRDSQGHAQYPEGFEALAEKKKRPKHPPGRDVRCIVSVSMLTEGWDCNTVTHIIGLRPFMSQLLCEQVVGRGLRRLSYDVGTDGLMSEEIAHVLGVPLSSFTVKKSAGKKPNRRKRERVYAVPGRAHYAIHFPRVEGYQKAVHHRITCDLDKVAELPINIGEISPVTEMGAHLPGNDGRPSLHGPGSISTLDLRNFRDNFRMQEKIYEMTNTLTRQYADNDECTVLPSSLFMQLFPIVRGYVEKKVNASEPASKKDVFLAPYFGMAVERILSALRVKDDGTPPETPRYEKLRGTGSTADVEFFTVRKLHRVKKSHINAVVADTESLEQQVATLLDRDDRVHSFVKNEGLGFAIPYLHNDELHDYMPDFIVRLEGKTSRHLILEPKGYDPLTEIKKSAARRWVDAVNADSNKGGAHGQWHYEMIHSIDEFAAAMQVAVDTLST